MVEVLIIKALAFGPLGIDATAVATQFRVLDVVTDAHRDDTVVAGTHRVGVLAHLSAVGLDTLPKGG